MGPEMTEEFVQVGVTAMIDPVSGEFLPAVPLYIRKDEGAEAAEEGLIKDLGLLFAMRMEAYMDGCAEDEHAAAV